MGKGGLANGKKREKEGLTNGKEHGDERGKEGIANGQEHVNEREKAGALDKQSSAELRPGDMTWVKLRGASWWPAQIVDKNAVSDDVKPRKGKSGEVLVRLYGTYTYSYMDPVASLLEFNNVLKRNKGGQREIFLKALEQDLSKLQSGRTNAQRAKARGKAVPSKRVTEEEDELKKKSKPSSLGYDDTPQKPEGSARRLKVMQDLGLTAPSGSPYFKNGLV